MGKVRRVGEVEGWRDRGASAPHRASVSAEGGWDASLPHPLLAASTWTSPEGRTLLAFTHATVRDYFVLAHSARDACAEPDGATRAHPVATGTPANSSDTPVTLVAAVSRASEAQRLLRAAEEALEGSFHRDVEAALDEGDPWKAVAAGRAMPVGSRAREVVLGRLHDAGVLGAVGYVVPPAPTSAQGGAMLAWLRAHLEDEAARSALEPLAFAEAGRILAEDGTDAVMAFAATLPGITGSCVADMAIEAEEQATPSP